MFGVVDDIDSPSHRIGSNSNRFVNNRLACGTELVGFPGFNLDSVVSSRYSEYIELGRCTYEFHSITGS